MNAPRGRHVAEDNDRRRRGAPFLQERRGKVVVACVGAVAASALGLGIAATGAILHGHADLSDAGHIGHQSIDLMLGEDHELELAGLPGDTDSTGATVLNTGSADAYIALTVTATGEDLFDLATWEVRCGGDTYTEQGAGTLKLPADCFAPGGGSLPLTLTLSLPDTLTEDDLAGVDSDAIMNIAIDGEQIEHNTAWTPGWTAA